MSTPPEVTARRILQALTPEGVDASIIHPLDRAVPQLMVGTTVFSMMDLDAWVDIGSDHAPKLMLTRLVHQLRKLAYEIEENINDAE